MNKLVKSDLFRYNEETGFLKAVSFYLRKPEFRYLVHLRHFQSGKLHLLWRLLLKYSTSRTHIEIGWHTHIGPGLLLVHPSGIAINNESVLGHNCTIYGGATVGMEFRGKRRGCPEIGNEVWIGKNATIVGNVKIGDDVLIAPNAFVNFDVPNHSIVIGNPAQIISRQNATEGYIVNKV